MVTTQPATVNHWPKTKCAQAFWGQHELPPYQSLLKDTIAWCEPEAGARWLDLGCGSGQLTRALWAKSHGQLQQIVGLDVAAVNDLAFQRLRGSITPPPSVEQIAFHKADFSSGLGSFADDHFDGAVSGLAIQYAESFDAARGEWTKAAYEHLLREVQRVLRPGGWFVFSVNVPNPWWSRVAVAALTGLFRAPKMMRFVKNSLRMWRYGSWLSQEARRGRFHYLPIEEIVSRLQAAGFEGIEHRLSFVKQAYVLRCQKPL